MKILSFEYMVNPKLPSWELIHNGEIYVHGHAIVTYKSKRWPWSRAETPKTDAVFLVGQLLYPKWVFHTGDGTPWRLGEALDTAKSDAAAAEGARQRKEAERAALSDYLIQRK